MSLGALTFGKVPTDKAELVRLSLQRRPMSGKDTEEEQLGSIDNHVVKSIVNGGNIDAAFPINVRVRVDNRLKVVYCIALLPIHLRNRFGCSQNNLALNKMVTRSGQISPMLPLKMVLPKKHMAHKRMITRSQFCQKKGKPNIVHIFITTDHNTDLVYISIIEFSDAGSDDISNDVNAIISTCPHTKERTIIQLTSKMKVDGMKGKSELTIQPNYLSKEICDNLSANIQNSNYLRQYHRKRKKQ